MRLTPFDAVKYMTTRADCVGVLIAAREDRDWIPRAKELVAEAKARWGLAK